MKEDDKKSYGAGGRNSSAGGSKGVQAGPEASLSSDCKVKVVVHLATLADNTSSENQLGKEQMKPADGSQEKEGAQNAHENERENQPSPRQETGVFKRSSLTRRSPSRQTGGEGGKDKIINAVGDSKTSEDGDEAEDKGGNVFENSKLLTRTPPRTHRTLSLDRERSSRGRKKRKAEQSPQMEQTRNEKATLWLRLVEKISNLRKLVTDNPTTKLEIKKNSEDLQSLVTVLSNLDDKSDDEDMDEDQEVLCNTMKSFSASGSQTDEVEYLTVATQTEKKANSNENDPKSSPSAPTAEEIRGRLVDGMDFQHVKQLIAGSWPKSVYSKSTLCKGGIMGQEVDDTRVILVNEDYFKSSILRKNLCAQVPGLKGKSTSQNGLLVIETKDSVKSEGEEEAEETQETRILVIVRLLPETGKDGVGYNEEDLYRKIMRVRQVVEEKTKESLSLAIPEDANLARTRKIIECGFANSSLKINLRLGKKIKYNSKSLSKTTNTSPNEVAIHGQEAEEGVGWEEAKHRKKKNQPQRRDNIIVVRQEGKSYSEILKAVKEGVNPANFPDGARVTSIQRSRKEHVIIRVKGNGKVAENLCKTVKERLPGFQANVKSERKAILHISDLDGETTSEEVKQGIKAELGFADQDSQEVEVTSLRPAFAGTQKATVKLSQSFANKLVRKRRILIGWISCRVKLREELQRCFRCWEVGHTASACKGPDKSGLCFSCGEAGHQKASCHKSRADQAQEDSTTNESPPA